MSAVTGSSTASETAATAPNATSGGITSLSGSPCDIATAMLDVAIAFAPALATTSAVATSHTFARMSGWPARWSARRAAASAARSRMHGLPRNVITDGRTPRNGEAVPGVDGDNGEDELCQFVRFKPLTGFVHHIVRDVRLGDERDRFGESQGSTFPGREERRLPPGGERIEPLFGLAYRSGVFAVHVEAVSAAVDLRASHLHELHKRMLQPGVVDSLLERADRAIAIRPCLIDVESRSLLFFHHGSILRRAGRLCTIQFAAPGEGHRQRKSHSGTACRTTPAASSSAMRPGLKPQSLSTSTGCSPSAGAPRSKPPRPPKSPYPAGPVTSPHWALA